MDGQITSYNASTGAMALSFQYFVGSGTYTSWTVNLIAQEGAQGFQGNQGAQGNQGFQGATQTLYNLPATLSGFVAWTSDLATNSATTTTPTKGIGYYAAIYLFAGQVLTNMVAYPSAVGTSATYYLGLYNSTTQLKTTAAITPSAAIQITALSGGAYTVPSSGIYFVACLVANGSTTSPTFTSTNFTANAPNGGWTAGTSGSLATLRNQYVGSSLTALPASISGTPTAIGSIPWIAFT